MKERAGEPGSEARKSLERRGGCQKPVTSATGHHRGPGATIKVFVAPPLGSDSAAPSA